MKTITTSFSGGLWPICVDIVIVGGLMAIAFVAISISGLVYFWPGLCAYWSLCFSLSPLPTHFFDWRTVQRDLGNAFHGH